MTRKGFIIDLAKHEIFKIVDYDDKIVESMFVKVGKELIPAAYVFPIECQDQVIKALDELKAAKKAYDDLTSKIYYKTFRAIRNGEKVYK